MNKRHVSAGSNSNGFSCSCRDRFGIREAAGRRDIIDSTDCRHADRGRQELVEVLSAKDG